MTDSRFSHVGLIAMEEGQAVVYDIRNSGVHRTQVGEMFADRHFHEAAIKRASHVSPEIRSAAVAYCRTALRDGRKFEADFRFDNDRLYCSELVELAYRESGLSLSEPLRLRDLPNYERHEAAG